MLVARVRVTAVPEHRQTLIAALTAETELVPAQFAGCERFDVSVDTTDENAVLIIEEWTSREHFEAYTSSDHFAGVMSVAGPCLAGAPDSAYYEAARVGP